MATLYKIFKVLCSCSMDEGHRPIWSDFRSQMGKPRHRKRQIMGNILNAEKSLHPITVSIHTCSLFLKVQIFIAILGDLDCEELILFLSS